MCSLFFSKYRFFFVFLMWPKRHHFFFFKPFLYMFFIGEPFVKQKCKHYVNRRLEGDPCSKFWKKNICSFQAQRGNKGSHFVFYDKETWPHIISQTWLFSLSRNFNSGKKNWFMLQFVPCFYSCFFLPKPPFQVFSLADIFFYFYFHAKRFARSLSRPVCPFYVDPPWNSKCRLCGENVMKKKDEFENLMLCRLDKCFKRYDIKHYLFIQPTDLTKACFVLFFVFFLPKLPS